MKMTCKSLLLLTTALALAPVAVQAQTTPTAPPVETRADATQLDDVIVTAQQRGENLQKAAVAVSVVSGEDLVRDGIRGLDLLQKSVPALQVAAGGQGNLIFIRGVGNFSFLSSSDPAAAFNYDGVYVGRSGSTMGAFYDLERIEVLKGPQGTLYGRNATAGAINVLPMQPRLGETSGYGMLGYGNYGAISGEGAFNAAVGDRAAIRLAATYSEHDGYLDDGTSAEKSGGLRAQFKAEVTDDLTIRLAADYAHQGGIAPGASYVGRVAFNPVTGKYDVTPSGLSLSEGLHSPASEAFRRTGTPGTLVGRPMDPLAGMPYQDFNVYGLNAQIDWKTPVGTVTVIPAWRKADKDNFNTQSGQNIGSTQTAEQYSIEARLVSNPGGPIDYILGAYYFNEEINDNTHNSAGVTANFLLADYETRSPSAYGRLTYHATDRLRFTGGLRYTEDHKSFEGMTRVLAVVCTVPAACATAPLLPYTLTFEQQPVIPSASGGVLPLAPGVVVRRMDTPTKGESDTSKVTYRGAIEFDLAPQVLAYASVETGYRAGGFNNDAPYAPENITAYTLGVKSRFLDNRAQLNVEIFDWDYKDQQLTFLGTDGTGRLGPITRNIGQSSIRGVDVEAMFRPTAGTTLSAAIQYVDSNYDSFVYLTPVRPYSGCAVTPVGAQFQVDCSGRRLFNSPEWTTNFGVEQIIPLGDLEIVLNADTQYRSSRDTGFEFTESEHSGPVWTSNAQVSLGPVDGAWGLAAYVRNIENERSLVYATPVPGSNLITSINSAPRTYGFRLTRRF